LSVSGRFGIRAVAGQGRFGQFHPVLEFHAGEITFPSRKGSIRQAAAGWVKPGFATTFQRRSNPSIVHQDRMSRIVIGFDTVHFVKSKPFPLTWASEYFCTMRGSSRAASKLEVEGSLGSRYISTVKFGLKIAVMLAVLALGVPYGAQALPNVHAVAKGVDEHYNHLRSLEAEFTEIYQGAGIQRTETGTLRLKKPGKMRWDYRSPEEKLFVSNGKDAWLYLPQEKQARRSALKNLDDLRSPLAFLLGKTKLEKELQGLSFAPDVQSWKQGDSILRGVPRGMEDQVDQVLLEISPDYRIVRILIQGRDDSITEYRFTDQKENVVLSDKQFEFTPPPGSETVDELANGQP